MTVSPPDNLDLIRRVLGANLLELGLGHLSVDEQPDGETRVKVGVIEGGKAYDVEGQGVGLVHAVYNALLDRFAIEYQSLKSIELAGFTVDADVETKKDKAGVDAVGKVTLDVTNSEGRRFTFSDSSRSVSASVARAVLAVVQYFVNAERAFILLHKARRDAVERGRHDLVARFTAELAEVVESTSYAEVIESIKKDAGV
ncbi:MAG: hypothetical protein H6709_16145 [Kofleriaceae bacterium]|nr:hypothetical protein [Myxococcales bacterium]MCB9563206.1 hypothetical protein [Kofleriaceae bacterium]MCB9573611.1 hypothetical protein [Kofleriaceae bacterium]